MTDTQFLSSARAGRSCALAMRVPNPRPVLDKNLAPMGPEILYGTGAGVRSQAPVVFPDCSSVLDRSQSANDASLGKCRFLSLLVAQSASSKPT